MNSLDDLEITPEEDDRSGSLATDLGIGYEFSSDFDVSFGVSAHNKLFISGEDYGLYLKSEYQKDFDKVSLTDTLTLDFQPFIYYDKSLGDWAWSLSTSLALELDWGLLP